MNDFNSLLQQKFPEMKPVRSAPTLTTINGIGTSAYGSRDFDAETGTYVKTLTFTILFIPFFALAAYRVADAPTGGWYFLGKVPLSPLARRWNWGVPLVLAGLVGVFFWHEHANSPAAVAARNLQRGDALFAAGKPGDAAAIYVLAEHHQPSVVQEKLSALLDSSFDAVDSDEVERTWRVLADFHQRHPLPNFEKRSLACAQDMAAAKRPAAARRILQVASEAGPMPPEFAAVYESVLTDSVADNPKDIVAVSALAKILETRQDFAACEKLLAPHAANLGSEEGARILGQIRSRQGQFDEAYALLGPYTEAHISAFQAADNTYQQVHADHLNRLRTGNVPDFDFKRYGRLGKDDQDNMVNDYLADKSRSDPAARRALAEMRRHGAVIPASLDFGIVLLRRAQNIPDAERRQTELEKAEKTFLAIQGAAGKSSEFKLSLGQVYYWMGKHDQGAKLLDEVGESNDLHTRMDLVHTLRELGERGKCVAILDDAYPKAADVKDRYQIASIRVLFAESQDDKIEWLDKCDPANLDVRSQLCQSRGAKALWEGRDADAIAEFRRGIAFLDTLPESSATLNNSALIYMDLAAIAGEKESFEEAMRRLDKAIGLRPRDSILLLNSADAILQHALTELIGPAIDRKALKNQGSLAELSFLYADSRSRDALYAKLRAHEGVQKATAYYERLLVLAPKNPMPYRALAKLYRVFDDDAKAEGLAKQLGAANVDISRSAKKDDPLHREKYRKDLDRFTTTYAKTLETARRSGGATFAWAVSTWSQARLGLHAALPDEPFDAEAICKLSDEATRTAPSAGATFLHSANLLSRAHDRLLAANADYRAQAEPLRQDISGPMLLAWIASRPGPLQKAVRGDPDVAAARHAMFAEAESFDGFASEWIWGLCREGSDERTARLVERLRKKDAHHFERVVADLLAPQDSQTVLLRIWRLELQGDADAARVLFDERKKEGTPLPAWN